MINYISWLVVLLGVNAENVQLDVYNQHPNIGLTIKQLVPKFEYPFEEHKIITTDGYVLELHRIPYGKKNLKGENRLPVLLQHGMLSCADGWVNVSPNRSLAYILADNGYDVWIGNHRGTTWSRKHVSLDPLKDLEQFWNFSFHEKGVFDNTAVIDYILNSTKQDQLYYIGHSQGTTSFFAMASTLPQYNKKIRLMVGLGPVTHTDNIKSPMVRAVLPFTSMIWEYFKKHKIYGILTHNVLIKVVFQVFCNVSVKTHGLCVTIMSLLFGFNIPQTDKSLVSVIGSTHPAGASWKQFSHYIQALKTGKFRHYDYGTTKNQKMYNQMEPPEYDLQKVTAPVALYYGNNDYLATDTNALRTAKALPNVISCLCVDGFNHIDFLWANDVVKLLYADVIKKMEKY